MNRLPPVVRCKKLSKFYGLVLKIFILYYQHKIYSRQKQLGSVLGLLADINQMINAYGDSSSNSSSSVSDIGIRNKSAAASDNGQSESMGITYKQTKMMFQRMRKYIINQSAK